MNDIKKAQIIGECLDVVQSRRKSKEECLREYPALKKDLIEAFLVLDKLQPVLSPLRSSLEARKAKVILLNKLPDRDFVVTKNRKFRYKWQNIKRRFAMSWVIIITTVLSLLSGAGAVYASNDALPGDFLFPVKTWVEDIQLSLSPDEVDAVLNLKFADRRLEEFLDLIGEGRYEDMESAVHGYQNHTRLMTELLAQIQAQDPETVIRLRSELQEKLQEQARIIEGYFDEADEEDDNKARVQYRVREMLQANEQARERIHETDSVTTDDSVDDLEEEVEESEETDSQTPSQNNGQHQNQNILIEDPEAILDDGVLKFQFQLKSGIEGGVYSKIGPDTYNCELDGVLIFCDMSGTPKKGVLKLYNQTTDQLLYSYEYEHYYEFEYKFEGTKETNGRNTGGEDDDSGKRDQDSGGSGKGGG